MKRQAQRHSVWASLEAFHRTKPLAAHIALAVLALGLFSLEGSYALRISAAPPFSVAITAPVNEAAYGGGAVSLSAVSPGAERVDFIVYSLFQPKSGAAQKTQITTFPATWNLASSTWDGMFSPAVASSHFFAYEVRALARRHDGMEVLSNGVDFTETFPTTSTAAVALAFAGNPNSPSVTLTSPLGGETASGVMKLTASVSPVVGQLHFMVWDGQGYTSELPAIQTGPQWNAAWDTRAAKDAAYWIEAEDITPSYQKFISYPVMVHINNSATSSQATSSTVLK